MMIQSIGGMIRTGEDRSNGGKTSVSATLSTTTLTWTGLCSNPTTAPKRVLNIQFIRDREHCACFTNTGRSKLYNELILVHGEHREYETQQCLGKVQSFWWC